MDYVKAQDEILRLVVSRRTFVSPLMVLWSPKLKGSLIDAVADAVMVEGTARVTNGQILTCCEEGETASRRRRLLRFGMATVMLSLLHGAMLMYVYTTYHQAHDALNY